MAWGRAALGLAVAAVLAVGLVSGGSAGDSVRHEYLPRSNQLRMVVDYGRVRKVDVRSLGKPLSLRPDSAWLGRARPLGGKAPLWASRLYQDSLLVLRAVVDPGTGAAVAGWREGWEYVWPRDAATVAIALAQAGYRSEARRVTRFLLGLDLDSAARFHRDGSPVDGRAAQGDAAGWVAVAGRAAGMRAHATPQPWRDRADYQEGSPGDYLGNALAGAAVGDSQGQADPDVSTRRQRLEEFVTGGTLVRRAGDPGSGLDSAAAWAVRPFPRPALYAVARRTLLRLAESSGRYGILPSESWAGGDDPWTAPTAWTAWSLATLARHDRRRGDLAASERERAAALRLIAALRRDATPAGMLPERVDARTGVPTSTTPLAWSHAFAILALRQLWPQAK
jgi:hypothetical protein